MNHENPVSVSEDVPSPVDLRKQTDAAQWANEVNVKRPWRYSFFEMYAELIQQQNAVDILELGSGPGFLAEYLLEHCPEIKYSALDFSDAMHQLSIQRLLPEQLKRSKFYTADFKQSGWNQGLGQYDMIIIHQALHELRHKKHALNFHIQIRKHLKDDAIYLVCDHLYADDAMSNNELYMSMEEHFKTFEQAGFRQVHVLKQIKGLCAFSCQKT